MKKTMFFLYKDKEGFFRALKAEKETKSLSIKTIAKKLVELGVDPRDATIDLVIFMWNKWMRTVKTGEAKKILSIIRELSKK